MSTKVMDIVKPRNKWERNLAHMEYMRIVWANLWEPCTYISVKYEGS